MGGPRRGGRRPVRVRANRPSGIAVSPDGKGVYVTNLGDDTVSQYDIGLDRALIAKTNPTVAAGALPDAIAIGPTGPQATSTTVVCSPATARTRRARDRLARP